MVRSTAARQRYRHTADGLPPAPTRPARQYSLEAITRLLVAQEHRCWGCLRLQAQGFRLSLVYVEATGEPYCLMCSSCIRHLHESDAVRWDRLAAIRRHVKPEHHDG